MADAAHLAILAAGVDKWNQWRRESGRAVANLAQADLRGKDLRNVQFGSCQLTGVDFREAVLDGADLSGATMEQAELAGTSLRDALLVASKMSNVGLQGADLTGADLRGAQLDGVQAQRAVFAGAVFADRSSFVAANLKGGNFVGADFSDAMMALVDLTSANLAHARLRETALMGAILDDVDCTGADLTEARMELTNCRRVSFRFSNLAGIRLRDALFDQVDLSGANLQDAVLFNVRMVDVDFSGCVLGRTTFANVDFATAYGLETAIHRGPSTIDVETALHAAAQLSDRFLSGVGVPPELMEHLRIIGTRAIKLRSCFISYSSKDERFARKLHRDLRRASVRVWFFPEDAKWGESVWQEIDSSIKLYDRLVVVCSAHSLVSGPVLREIERALQREDQDKLNVLCPLRVDEYMFTGWTHPRKADVLGKVVGDFSGWRNSPKKYNAALARLIAALSDDK
jgi:uncharacterized protein YjbI with pentapeptide repeats